MASSNAAKRLMIFGGTGFVGSAIARDAPWPLAPIVQCGMGLAFPSPTEAALPVIELALLGADAPSAVHYHMSEPKAAGAGADDLSNGSWLWEETERLIRARQPPVVEVARM